MHYLSHYLLGAEAKTFILPSFLRERKHSSIFIYQLSNMKIEGLGIFKRARNVYLQKCLRFYITRSLVITNSSAR